MSGLDVGSDWFPLEINDRGQIVGYHCGGGCVGLAEVTAHRRCPESLQNAGPRLSPHCIKLLVGHTAGSLL